MCIRDRFPRVVTELGIVISVNAVQSSNAEAPMEVKVSGNLADDNDEHPLKAPSFIVVSLDGSETDDSFVQPKNAFGPIVVTVDGTAKAPCKDIGAYMIVVFFAS